MELFHSSTTRSAW